MSQSEDKTKTQKEQTGKAQEPQPKAEDQPQSAVRPEAGAVEVLAESAAALENKETKDKSGLVELPESIRAKLEKRQAVSAREKKARKRKGKKKGLKARQVTVGKAYIKSTYNNTIVTLTDLNGNVLAWASAGVAGFKGPKKATPYAAQIITRIASEKAQKEYGLKEISVFVKGVGTGREAAIRALNANGFMITSIKDITPIPHNGCRQPRPRRV